MMNNIGISIGYTAKWVHSSKLMILVDDDDGK